MANRDRTSAYDAFTEEEVAEAEKEMALNRLSKDLGRALTDEDILIWLRSRRALPGCTLVQLAKRENKIGIIGNDSELWLSRECTAELVKELVLFLLP